MDFRMVKIVVGIFFMLVVHGFAAEPIAEREWTSDAGTKLTASAVELRGDTVIFKSSDGRQIDVPLERLVEADQATLREHFKTKSEPDEQAAEGDAEAESSVEAGKEEFTGEVRDRILGGDLGHFTAYIPSSVKVEDKRPAFCYVDMRQSGPQMLDKLKAGSEVTGWTVVLSSELRGEASEMDYLERLGKGWLEAMKNELPVDTDRLFGVGYSSGVKGMMQMRKVMGGFDGVLTVSGSFSEKETGLPVCYGMIGLGSSSRVNFTKDFEKRAGRGSLIRYTADGRGDVSEGDYEDGMIYLAIDHYSGDGARKPEELVGFVDRLLGRAQAVSASDPERAYMWIKQSEKLRKNEAQRAKWEALHKELGAMERCVAYYKGFEMFENLGYKVIASAQTSVDGKANDKLDRELERMKKALEGTKWIPVIESFSKGD